MREHPLILKTEMVQAIQENRKTQTRCPIKPQPILINNRTWEWPYPSIFNKLENKWILSKASWGNGYNPTNVMIDFCPWKIGDRLWVRETWAIGFGGEILYKADEKTTTWIWKPSIHMPKWAARIWREITEIRVERLQDISEEDAIAEGFKKYLYGGYDFDTNVAAIANFHRFWDSFATNFNRWDFNPWVWVREFKRIK